jgi:hypothetical protein
MHILLLPVIVEVASCLVIHTVFMFRYCTFYEIVMIPQIFIRTGGPITVMTHETGRNLKIEPRSDVCLRIL